MAKKPRTKAVAAAGYPYDPDYSQEALFDQRLEVLEAVADKVHSDIDFNTIFAFNTGWSVVEGEYTLLESPNGYTFQGMIRKDGALSMEIGVFKEAVTMGYTSYIDSKDSVSYFHPIRIEPRKLKVRTDADWYITTLILRKL